MGNAHTHEPPERVTFGHEEVLDNIEHNDELETSQRRPIRLQRTYLAENQNAVPTLLELRQHRLEQLQLGAGIDKIPVHLFQRDPLRL